MTDNTQQMDGDSMNIAQQKQQELEQLFPGVFTETKNDKGEIVKTLDVERLKAELGEFSEVYDNRRERYGMDWPGKKDCLRLIQEPSHATLNPCREESVDFDTTQNLFIEGDNLEVLKLLQKSYYGEVKMIYIDPPYNTGKEFIYPDNYSESLDTYLEYAGLKEKGGDGRKWSTNSQNEGRFHTKWLNMMYPRLYLARSLLREDGFFVASIDDAEIENLSRVLNEIFGEENHLATLVWDRNRKNDARYVSVGHEYMLIYCRNSLRLSESGVVLREELEGLSEARAVFENLRNEHGDNYELIRSGWMAWFDNIPLADPRRRLQRYSKVGERGPYRDDGNISWPGGNGPRYEILHPTTKKPVPVPSRGWVFPNEKRFWEEYQNGRVVFGPDHSTSARIASYLFESDGQVLPSVFYSYAQKSAQEFSSLMGDKVFDNPKNWRDLKRLIDYFTNGQGIILDFFAGSASFAHAAYAANFDGKSRNNFIAIQLPETCDEKSIAKKSGYKTIAEIAKERIRLAGDQFRLELEDQLDLECKTNLDLGFKVLKLNQSNFKQWQAPSKDISDEELVKQFELNVDHIDPNTPKEYLLYELLIKSGVKPTEKIESIELEGHSLYSVDEGILLIHLEDDITPALIEAVVAKAPQQFICLDSAFHGNDQLKTNAAKSFEAYNQGKENIDRIEFLTV